jgi:O-methyltransferase
MGSDALGQHSRNFVRKVAIWSRIAAGIFRGLLIYRRYRDFTMVPPFTFARNLALCAIGAPASGCIVECGVWRGGMSAGMADMLPDRFHLLFDSFEGLPPATDTDGPDAIAWQKDTSAENYFDNCRAERGYAERAMQMSAAKCFKLVQGWFQDTLVAFKPEEPIAILRLDGDWYESTMQCLTALYPHVMTKGLIIIDDYYAWDGCSRAVHDFLSRTQSLDRIEAWGSVCFIKKGSAGRLESTVP